jgi:hypothetical protein
VWRDSCNWFFRCHWNTVCILWKKKKIEKWKGWIHKSHISNLEIWIVM